MKVYLVGGAVRDNLLGYPCKEKDWVVVGSTPEALLAQGFVPVGKDFPVFLHPKTKEEWALARTERKTSSGYKGFNFCTDPSITLSDDLKRRDLTINAMAQDKDGIIYDPFDGQADCKNRLLRHVSDAFNEDPLRVLRIARFAAKLPDFSIHPDTQTRLTDMVNSGEIATLTPERVWKELSRALMEPAPWRFFEVLSACGAQQALWPYLPTSTQYLGRLHHFTSECTLDVRFAALWHGIELKQTRDFCNHYRVPSSCTQLADLISKNSLDFDPKSLNHSDQILHYLISLDAIRRPERFTNYLDTLALVYTQPQSVQCYKKLKQALARVSQISQKDIVATGITGKAVGEAIFQKRLAHLQAWLDKQSF